MQAMEGWRKAVKVSDENVGGSFGGCLNGFNFSVIPFFFFATGGIFWSVVWVKREQKPSQSSEGGDRNNSFCDEFFALGFLFYVISPQMSQKT